MTWCKKQWQETMKPIQVVENIKNIIFHSMSQSKTILATNGVELGELAALFKVMPSRHCFS